MQSNIANIPEKNGSEKDGATLAAQRVETPTIIA